MFFMSFSISMNLRPSVPLSNFANLTSAVNDSNENMINNMIAATMVTLNALVNVFIVDLGTAAIIVVTLVVSLARELIPTFTISVNEENSPVAEAIIMTMTAGMMKYIISKIIALMPMINCFT